MFGWLFGRKKLKDVLNETRKIRVSGITFTIRKVNLLDYLAGSKVLIQAFDTHKTAGAKIAGVQLSDDKVKRHYADILVAGVVDPKLTHKKENENDPAVLVDDLFPNWGLVEELYAEIMAFTYGKKKFRQAILAAKDLSKSTPSQDGTA